MNFSFIPEIEMNPVLFQYYADVSLETTHFKLKERKDIEENDILKQWKLLKITCMQALTLLTP